MSRAHTATRVHPAMRRGLALALATVLVSTAFVVPTASAGQPQPQPQTSERPAASASGGAKVRPGALTSPLTSSAPNPAATIVPYGASGYRYLQVPYGGQPTGWQATTFNDSAWNIGGAAFGSGGSCPLQPTVVTTWQASTDVLVRRQINLPAGTSGVTVFIAVDNDVTVYWNGTSIGSVTHDGCPGYDDSSFQVPAALLAAGSNILAVDGHDRGVESFIDISVRGTVGGPLPPELLGNGHSRFGANPNRMRAEPVNTATGNYVNQVTDLSMPGRGIPFVFIRTYNSLDSSVGILGPGWRQSFGSRFAFDPSGNATLTTDDGAQYFFTVDAGGDFAPPLGSTALLKAVTGGYQLTRQDQIVYHFDSSGNLTSQTDRNGNTLTFAYASGQLTTITDTVGRVVTLTYTSGKLTKLTDPIGRTVSYAYNGAGQLASVTDVRNGLTSYTYDASGKLTTVVDQNTHTMVTNTYDPTSGRVTQQLDALGDKTTFAWNATTTTSTMTDARTGTWVDVYANGLLASSTDPLSHTTS